MNKKLVAVAVAGALALPLAAQAQTANVTLYGRVHVDVEVVNGRQANGSNPNVFRVSSNSSRFGLRGTESLGSGLSAIFQIESSVNADAGGGTLGGRDTFVGLQGSWGKFRVGNYLFPLDDLTNIFGNVPTFQTSILNQSNIWANGSAGSSAAGHFDNRPGNSVRYDTPNMSGFSGSVAYSTGEGLNVQNSGVLGANLLYTNGPIELGVGYELHEDMRGRNLDDSDWSVAAAYNFGFIRPAVVYERLKYETLTGDLKRDLWGGSLTFPMGRGTWYALYEHGADGKGSAAKGTRVGGLARGPDTASNMWELTYSYPLSKRTIVYAGYVKLDNKCNASYNFNINAYPIGQSGGCFGKPQGYLLGMNHLF